jgi:hypothetical protein
MQEAGWVYLLMNPSMSGLIKIGKTTRDPDDRVQELSGVTGVPTPFVLVYKAFFNNCHDAESYIHTLLETQEYRLSNNREFFTAPIDVGINAIMKAKEYFGAACEHPEDIDQAVTDTDSSDVYIDIIRAGDECNYGIGDTIQNTGQALKHYMNAYKLGAPEACLPIGKIFSTEKGYVDEKKAIDFFNEGIRRGVGECYAELALLYAEKGHIDNSIKCWNKFFDAELYNEYVKGMYECEYLRAVKSGKIGLIHKDVLFERFDWIVDTTNRMIKTHESQGNDPSFLYAELDFASYALMGTFISGHRHNGVIKKILDNNEYVVDDEKKNFWIFYPDAVLDNSQMYIGLNVEYNLVKLPNIMPIVCNIVKVNPPSQSAPAVTQINQSADPEASYATEHAYNTAPPKRGWLSKLFG